MNGSADIASLVPSPDDFLALSTQQQSMHLLKLLEPTTSQFSVSYQNFFNGANDGQNPPKYGAKRQRDEVDPVLMHAWNSLEVQGLITKSPTGLGGWYFISASGKEALQKQALHEKWERQGLDRVKSDLEHNRGKGIGNVGGGSKEVDWAWEWVRAKNNQGTTVNIVTSQKQRSRKVFVVHGHDSGAKEQLARFLERLDFEPIILHEQASRGRTVIEKVEAHSDDGFAVVLLTPDDEGCEKDGTPRPRARQNVVLELGYFLGHLGRTQVCALKRGNIEIPSDFDGVVYVDFDNSDGWKQTLGRELEATGFEVDWSKAMGTKG